MMSKLFFLFVTTLAASVLAGEHREESAHQHGAGSLGIAFDGTKGRMDFKITSESIFGFEYVAKSKTDKIKMNDGLSKLETKISEMVAFDASLKCAIVKEKIEVVFKNKKSKHSDTVASFTVLCEKSPVGTTIIFSFQRYFPNIKDLDVEVVADAVQKSVEATKNNTQLTLK